MNGRLSAQGEPQSNSALVTDARAAALLRRAFYGAAQRER